MIYHATVLVSECRGKTLKKGCVVQQKLIKYQHQYQSKFGTGNIWAVIHWGGQPWNLDHTFAQFTLLIQNEIMSPEYEIHK